MAIKISLLLLLLVTMACRAENVLKIEGPSEGLFPGDFYKFSCKINSPNKLLWIFETTEGIKYPVAPEELGEDISHSTEDSEERKSFLRIPFNLRKIICQETLETEEAFLNVHVYPFKRVQTLREPYDILLLLPDEIYTFEFVIKFYGVLSRECGVKPRIIMKRWSQSYDAQYWHSHFVGNETVKLHRGYRGVSGLKLTCLSRDEVNWIIRDENNPGLRRKVESFNGGCHISSITISPLSMKSDQEYGCRQKKYSTSVRIAYYDESNKFGYMDDFKDFNKTQECVKQLGSTIFGTGTLTWTTTGSSFVTVAMMVGMFFLKRQLNQTRSN